MHRSATTTASSMVDSDGSVPAWVLGVAVGLLVTIWLIPPEAAMDGETSWRAIAWLVLASLFAGQQTLRRTVIDVSAPRGNWFDLAIGLVIAGQLLGAMQVWLIGGQKRSAANLAIEWLGLAAAWWVLRRIGHHPDFRRAIAPLMISAASAAAVLGLWQHYVALPEMAREFGPKIAEVRAAMAEGIGTPAFRELAAAGIPTAEPGLGMFERRLLSSQEPFALFGLANTLAGLLASAMLWLFCGLMPAQRSDWRWKSHAPSLLLLLLMAWCLILTKSRTALIGVVLGMVCWSTLRLLGPLSARSFSRWGLSLVGLCVAVVLLPWLLTKIGVWDGQVLSEAPKSLTYRLQYWSATMQLIREHPWLGVGLGQFRQHYLRVKWPAASEEISDPHNLWCDAWVNGGCVSVLGLLLACLATLFCVRWLSSSAAFNPEVSGAEKPVERSNASTGTIVVVGGMLATPLWLFVQAYGGAWDDRLLAMGVLIPVFFWILSRSPVLEMPPATQGWCAVWALVPLFVHLHGAGGFEMSGVGLWAELLLVVAMSAGATIPPGASQVVPETPASTNPWPDCVAACGMLGVTSAVIVGLWLPDVRCRQALDETFTLSSRQPESAKSALLRAAAADDWNPTPWGQLGDLARQSALQQQSAREPQARVLDELHQADEFFQALQRRDPYNPHGWVNRAEIAALAHSVSHNPHDLSAAVDAWAQAVAMYPTNAAYLTQWAFAAEKAGATETALAAAQRALQQDQLNHDLWHLERWLPEIEHDRLESLVRRHEGGHPPEN
ncbi:hypothetical protein GC163_05575 [bacterium]|nr:hypothetical protein [bacterium]